MTAKVLPLRPGTPFDHFHYIVYCPETREAAAIDPFDDAAIRAAAAAHRLDLKMVVNTHEHWDHAGRNAAMKASDNVQILAPHAAAGTLQDIDRTLKDGDVIRIGNAAELKVIATPGHTMASICLAGSEGGTPFLISGDTLFAGGAGNCGYGGHAPSLYATLVAKIAPLADETILYPGHDYLARNLRFADHVDPGNEDVRAVADDLARLPADRLHFTTLAEERRINPFLRCGSSGLRRTLPSLAPGLDPAAEESEMFVTLRAYRDHWADTIAA
ncbi:hydroxyacylglutathione hydrolase C-terminal domain-containing protein [Sphingosinicella rhizophila]|uniref:Hydroxyacylglutathione hydrolase C-terminal domain-containing protein n=1 Tax=Sphingosinicella rhizophila TaxID=3050082 RepID=A0ABU3Q6U8_9SPHN|nr:hydroxyacylglutathione hydrolase C-terminal domain-containing protein [Sphingosinicella sp. GR2756]MDT9599138.1 hydroxyacylglutathione hydrolase C-terminal domain-containing protein [Sphingosinicella sp. GR2756]